MTQTRKKRRLRANADNYAHVQSDLQLPEVAEALAGEALAVLRERELADREAAEQEALIAATQETEEALDNAFQLKRTVESLLFASDRPLTISCFRQYLGGNIVRADLQASLDELVSDYKDRGIVLHDVAGGYQFRTHPASSAWIQKLIAGRPVRLSRAQLDTLAIVAYRQPITRPEIDEIRGVDSGSTLKVLLDRSLIRIMGKKEEVGRPLLYGTTKDFLEFFNLGELRDLPTLREFHELNDEGMAQVDKLGADIDGVDVGAVAAEVARERVLAEEAVLAAAEELAAEKKAAREAARAEKLAEAQSSEAASTDDELALADELAGDDALAADDALAGGEPHEESAMMHAEDEEDVGRPGDEDESTRVDTEPAPVEDSMDIDSDTLMETVPGSSYPDTGITELTHVEMSDEIRHVVDRAATVEEDNLDSTQDVGDSTEQTISEVGSVGDDTDRNEFDAELTAPDGFVAERGSADPRAVTTNDSSE